MQDDLVAAARPSAVILPLASGSNRGQLTLRELADGYMAAYSGRDTARAHRVQFWIDEIGDTMFAELDADQVATVLERLAQQPVTQYVGGRTAGLRTRRVIRPRRAPATLNRYRTTLSAILTWARHKRLTPKGWQNPVHELRAESENNSRTRFLTPDERERLLRVCRLSAWPQLHLLVLMAITTGARRGELLALRYGDLDLEAATAHVRTSKNGEQRVLPLTPAVVAEIRRLGLGGPDGLLFACRTRPSQAHAMGHVWATALKTARIEAFKFHDLRHSCASYLAQQGASLLEIADVLGHKSLRMTQRYSHLTIDSKRRLVHRVLGDIGVGTRSQA